MGFSLRGSRITTRNRTEHCTVCTFCSAACPTGTYKNSTEPGDVSTCTPCPDENHVSPRGSASVTACSCRRGYHDAGNHRCAGETPSLSRRRRSLPLPNNISNFLFRILEYTKNGILFIFEVLVLPILTGFPLCCNFACMESPILYIYF